MEKKHLKSPGISSMYKYLNVSFPPQQSENIYRIGKKIIFESKNTQCRIQELKQSLPTRQEF